MTQKDLTSLTTAFVELTTSKLNGVPGVWVAHSGKPGPAIGITIMTHGNEPCGLAAYQYFRHEYDLGRQLQRGSVYFVLNNIEAGWRYLAAAKEGDEEAKRSARFVDINMNRLPARAYDFIEDQRYEILRAQELRPVWDLFDIALDIHSTSQDDAEPMIVALERSDLGIVEKFPIATIISHIDAIQKEKPAAYFYGKGSASVYAIEAGSHEREDSFKIAIACIAELLGMFGLILPEKHLFPTMHREYEIFDSVFFPNESYQLARKIPNFTHISKGDVIGVGNGDPVLAPVDGIALLAPKQLKPSNIAEEVMFLAHHVD